MTTQGPATLPQAIQPFAGLRVLDISQGIAGPYCAHILWQQGAEVIKIEPPQGDWGRGLGVVRNGHSSLTIAFNGGKRALSVDGTTTEGKAILGHFARSADIVIENFRPGVAARLGLDATELRRRDPKLIFVSISGYGQEGPYVGAPATDSVVQADAGLMFCNRGSDAVPRKIGVYLADINSGLYAAQAVSAALYNRLLTGTGAYIELNLFDTCAATMVCNYAEHAMDPDREMMPTTPISAPNGTFQASDGAINVVTVNDHQFARACAAVDHPEWATDPRFADQTKRVHHANILTDLFAERICRHSVAYWMTRFQEFDILHAPVRDFSQCIDHPQAKHLGTFELLDQPGIGEMAMPATPVRSLRRPMEASPRIGEHSEQILEKAGFTRDQIEQWIRSGVVVRAGSSA